MADTTVQDILNMKTSELKEWLEGHHIPVPKRQSKEFLQTVALHTHSELASESLKQRTITRRRSKREESDQNSTYSSIHGKSTMASLTSSSTITTRSRAASFKVEAESSNRKEEDIAKTPPDQDGLLDPSHSTLSLAAQNDPNPLDTLNNLKDPRLDHEDRSPAIPLTEPTLAHGEIAHESDAKLATTAHTNEEATPPLIRDKSETTPHKETKESNKISDQETKQKQIRANQEVIKKIIIRVNDEDDQKEKSKRGNWIKRHLPQKGALAMVGIKGHLLNDGDGQVSGMQRLKRSGNMIISQVNERVIKRLKMVPSRLHLARPRPHVSVVLAMCAVMTAIGIASYWYHLDKKFKEQRARKRWW